VLIQLGSGAIPDVLSVCSILGSVGLSFQNVSVWWQK
jgi:hypothetical protein